MRSLSELTVEVTTKPEYRFRAAKEEGPVLLPSRLCMKVISCTLPFHSAISAHFCIAIDKTQDPYYGKRDNTPDLHIVGGKNKKSTNYFFADDVYC